MSYSYSGDPNASTRDKVRFLIQDTNSSDWQLTDEEIEALLADSSNNPTHAAAAASDILAAHYSRLADKVIGDLSIKLSQIAANYLKLSARLGRTASIPAPYCGGISVSDKQSVEMDIDRVSPGFTIDLYRIISPETGSLADQEEN